MDNMVLLDGAVKRSIKKATVNTLKTTRDGKIKKANFSKGGLIVGLDKKKMKIKLFAFQKIIIL